MQLHERKDNDKGMTINGEKVINIFDFKTSPGFDEQI